MKQKLFIKWGLVTIVITLFLGSCSTHKLPTFSNQQWHVDAYTGNAISTSGLELAFGCEWMIRDTTLMQSLRQIEVFPKLSDHLANGIARFSEIEIDSIFFYQPDRGLLFTTYHQIKPLKPTSEICLYADNTGAYSEEYARIFGNQYTAIDDSGWESGPTNSVYTNVRYNPKDKYFVLLQRIPYKGKDLAIFQIWATIPKRGKWWEDYPPGTFLRSDFGNTDNIETISNILQWSRNTAVENLSLSLSRSPKAPYSRADSLLAEFKYSEALSEYMNIYENSKNAMKSGAAMNAAIAAAQCDNDSLAISFVNHALESDATFFDERISVTELLENCRLMPQWDAIQEESERRLAVAMTSYNIPLRNVLLDIYHSDQNPRGHLIKLFKSDPANKEGFSRLWAEIHKNDSINLSKTIEMLDRYGWIPRSKVGTANQALFFVIQHANPDIIEKYISLFELAAKENDIPRELYAKMYDRHQMYAGKPQRYGTQRVQKDQSTNEMVLWKIEDPDKVNALRKEMNLPPLDGYPQ